VSGTTARGPHLDGGAFEQLTCAIATVAAALGEAGAELRHIKLAVHVVISPPTGPLMALLRLAGHASGSDPVRITERPRSRLNINDILIHPTVICLETAPGYRTARRASVWRSSARRRPNRRGSSMGTRWRYC